ncbi:MAG: pirin family protein [Bdellovibrionales bacterium]|nr:pirin family protein [Bdellovibrionales bacterium]
MPITHLIEPRKAQIADEMFVTRILPFREKRMVGPFCFLDHMGPARLKGGGQSDVLAHPHIGLSTLTYLFEGQMVHRDSLGTVQTIRAGEVNWMTAGKGIVHSERVPDEIVA